MSTKSEKKGYRLQRTGTNGRCANRTRDLLNANEAQYHYAKRPPRLLRGYTALHSCWSNPKFNSGDHRKHSTCLQLARLDNQLRAPEFRVEEVGKHSLNVFVRRWWLRQVVDTARQALDVVGWWSSLTLTHPGCDSCQRVESLLPGLNECGLVATMYTASISRESRALNIYVPKEVYMWLNLYK